MLIQQLIVQGVQLVWKGFKSTYDSYFTTWQDGRFRVDEHTLTRSHTHIYTHEYAYKAVKVEIL